MTELLVGCPVTQRNWVLPQWFDHVFQACETAFIEPAFVFVVPTWDTDTADCIVKCSLREATAHSVHFIRTDEPEERQDPNRRAHWDRRRVNHMVILRNAMLEQVRRVGPEYFWSLDSDILPDAGALSSALDVFVRHDCSAVGMHLYLSGLGRQEGSKAQLVGEHLMNRQVHESEFTGSFPTEVVMGSILMKPNAYHLDYKFSVEGEDVGFALNAKTAGVRFYWCADALCKHVNTPAMLDKVDPRVGF